MLEHLFALRDREQNFQDTEQCTASVDDLERSELYSETFRFWIKTIDLELDEATPRTLDKLRRDVERRIAREHGVVKNAEERVLAIIEEETT